MGCRLSCRKLHPLPAPPLLGHVGALEACGIEDQSSPCLSRNGGGFDSTRIDQRTCTSSYGHNFTSSYSEAITSSEGRRWTEATPSEELRQYQCLIGNEFDAGRLSLREKERVASGLDGVHLTASSHWHSLGL